MSPDLSQTLIVCGISGVGKTYQIRSVIEQLPGAVTWSASEISSRPDWWCMRSNPNF